MGSRHGRTRRARTLAAAADDPFAALGLAARPDLSDDDVRGAWRRIAAATHPDRFDGGDPGSYSAAAAAYAVLRTGYGRGEALADLRSGVRRGGRVVLPGVREGGRDVPGVRGGGNDLPTGVRGGGRDPLTGDHRGRHRALPAGRRGTGHFVARRGPGASDARGRPGVLMLRTVAAVAVGAVTVLVAGWAPASIGVLAGAVTWLAVTGRHDLPAWRR